MPRPILRVRLYQRKWPTVCSIPCPPNDDDQDGYQDRQQVVKVELTRCVKPLKVDELINQNHPLFIGKFLGSEARHEHDEIDNRLRYIEKHLEPPLISSSYQSICGGCRPPCSLWVWPAARWKG